MSTLHKKVTKEVKDILLNCGLKEDALYTVTGNSWSLDDIIALIEANYEILFSDTHYNAERMF